MRSPAAGRIDPAHPPGSRWGPETPAGARQHRPGYAPVQPTLEQFRSTGHPRSWSSELDVTAAVETDAAAAELADSWRARSGRFARLGVASPLVVVPAAAIVALDQLTKWLVRQELGIGERWPAEPVAGVFTFTHVANTGVAFGLFQGNSQYFVIVAALVVAALIVYLGRLPRHANATRFAVGLQIGGAVGNLVDRLNLGHVTDFLDFQVFPVFNVADSAIVVGVLILGLELWKEEQEQSGGVVLTAGSQYGD